MKNLRVTYYNQRLNSSSKERTEDVLKNIYWRKGEEPADWRNFDGEIQVKAEQTRGGDYATVRVIDDIYKWVIRDLNSERDIRFVEIELTKDNFREVKAQNNQVESYQVGEFIQI